jgi:hypothetical protein
MGKFLSKYLPQVLEDPFDESRWQLERCRCQDPNKPIFVEADWNKFHKLPLAHQEEQHPRMLATYRCQYETDQFITDRGVPGHPLLDPYWRSSSFGGDTCIQFVACERCITEEANIYFTHHPEGWKCHYMVKTDYEGLRRL